LLVNRNARVSVQNRVSVQIVVSVQNRMSVQILDILKVLYLEKFVFWKNSAESVTEVSLFIFTC